MTIAACYLSPEGVVLGADSATTFGSRNHFFHGQKIYEIGTPGESTLGLTMWGLGSMGEISYRTLIARFTDEVIKNPGRSVTEAAEHWRNIFWDAYKSHFVQQRDRIRELQAKSPLTDEEKEELAELESGYSGGFCLGGHALSDRSPKAFSMT